MVKKKVVKEKKDFLQGVDLDAAIPYNNEASYSQVDIISPMTFGFGKVDELITPNKMVVQFTEGEKNLLCFIPVSIGESH